MRIIHLVVTEAETSIDGQTYWTSDAFSTEAKAAAEVDRLREEHVWASPDPDYCDCHGLAFTHTPVELH